MERVLIDTDVVLDFFFDRKPFSAGASEILSLCEYGMIQGLVTPIMLSNIYYLLRKTSSHNKVIANLKLLLTFIDIVEVNKEIVLQALNSDFKDFEDALQNFSAVCHEEVKIVITRNIKDYRTSRLAIMTPEVYLVSR